MQSTSESASEFLRLRKLAESDQVEARFLDEWIKAGHGLCEFNEEQVRLLMKGLSVVNDSHQRAERFFAESIGDINWAISQFFGSTASLMPAYRDVAMEFVKMGIRMTLLQRDLIEAWPWVDTRKAIDADKYFRGGGKGIPLRTIVDELRH